MNLMLQKFHHVVVFAVHHCGCRSTEETKKAITRVHRDWNTECYRLRFALHDLKYGTALEGIVFNATDDGIDCIGQIHMLMFSMFPHKSSPSILVLAGISCQAAASNIQLRV